MKIAGIFLSILMLFIWSATVYGVAEDALILALSFDEGGGTKARDSSSYGNDGSVEGAKWTADGRFGGALEFDGEGGDVVIVPDSPELLLLEGGTLMAWSYIMTEFGHADWPRIIIKAPDNRDPTTGYDFLFDRANLYALRFCVTACGDSHIPADGIPADWTENWHHVAVTFDGEVIKTYADGELIDEVPQSGPTMDSTGNDLHIGNGAGFTADLIRPFHGMHDEIRIFDRALEEDEIKLHMEQSTNEVVAVQPRSKLATTWADIKAEWTD